jgi:hypothetical protein
MVMVRPAASFTKVSSKGLPRVRLRMAFLKPVCLVFTCKREGVRGGVGCMWAGARAGGWVGGSGGGESKWWWGSSFGSIPSLDLGLGGARQEWRQSGSAGQAGRYARHEPAVIEGWTGARQQLARKAGRGGVARSHLDPEHRLLQRPALDGAQLAAHLANLLIPAPNGGRAAAGQRPLPSRIFFVFLLFFRTQP